VCKGLSDIYIYISEQTATCATYSIKRVGEMSGEKGEYSAEISGAANKAEKG
jgi:hypothetical protein